MHSVRLGCKIRTGVSRGIGRSGGHDGQGCMTTFTVLYLRVPSTSKALLDPPRNLELDLT